MRANSLRPTSRLAFTLIELLVVVAIIAILASLLFPALARAKDKGKTTKCASNLKQLIVATIMYEEDTKYYPTAWPPPLWYTQLQPWLGKKTNVAGMGVFICPSSYQKRANGTAGEGGFLGYLAYAQNSHINANTTKMSSTSIADPENTIMYADTDGWDAALYPDESPVGNVLYRHSGGNERSATMDRGVKGVKGSKRRANAVFVAGHVELIRKAPLRLFTPVRD